MTLAKLGLCDDPGHDLTELAAGLISYRDRYAIDSATAQNPAKQLAERLHNKVPVIYSGTDRIDTVATRWKGQICENAEMLAFCNVFPEFNHNELVGWHILGEFAKSAIVVYLRDSEDRPEIGARMDAVRTLLNKENIEIIDIFSHGDFRLGQMFSLIQLGDFASFYLAILNKVDPTPVKAIDFLKDQLAKIEK
jgi:glucose/mannose-6-phosphate isomerase